MINQEAGDPEKATDSTIEALCNQTHYVPPTAVLLGQTHDTGVATHQLTHLQLIKTELEGEKKKSKTEKRSQSRVFTSTANTVKSVKSNTNSRVAMCN